MNNFKWLFAIPVVAVAVIFLLPELRQSGNQPHTGAGASAVTITPVGAQFFGTLSKDFVSGADPKTRNSAPTEMAVGTVTSDLKGLPSPLPSPEGVTYRYVYTGAPLQLSSTTLDVLQRKEGQGISLTADLLGELGLGAVNLSTFNPATVQNITLAQSDGYTVYVDGLQGSLNIYRTSSITPKVQTSAVAPSQVDIPSDASLISIADDFLRIHGITTSAYSQPIVQHQSYGAVTASSDSAVKEIAPLPYYVNEMSVLYPLLINRMSVHGLWGNVIGMNVNINLQDSRVMSVYNLTTHRYVAAAYPAVTDSTTILKVAERGGVYGTTPTPVAGAKMTDVQLGTPERVFASMYRYNGTDSGELLVPALRFPVQDAQTGMPTEVIIPLVKDMLTDGPQLIEPDAGFGGGSGSAVNGSTVAPSAP